MAQTIDLLKNTSFEDKMDLLIEAILKGENYDYVQLLNKPSINGYTLEGNKTNAQLGIPTKTSNLENDSGFITDVSYVHTDNNFTTTLKTKLEGIEDNAQKNVQADWNETESTNDAFIKNKPTIPTKTSELVNDENFVTDSNYVHTDENFTAELKTKLDGIEDGAEKNIQADWSTVDNTDESFIKNKPTIPTKTSELKNDSGYVEDSSYVHTDNNYTNADKASVATIENKVDKVEGKGLSTNDYTTADKEKLSGIADGATKVEVDSKLSSTSTNPVQNKVINEALSEKASLEQGNKADSAVQSVKIGETEYKVGTSVVLPSYPTTLPASDVPDWAKQPNKPTYTKDDVGLGNVGNFKAVSTVADQGLTSVEQTNARVNIGAGTSNFSGKYDDLNGKPTLGTASEKDIPTTGDASATQVVMGNDSRLTNARKASDVYDWAKAETKPTYTKSEVGLGNVPNVTTNNQAPTFTEATNRVNIVSGETVSTLFGKIMKWFADLKAVAFSGSYRDLTNRPNFLSNGSQTKTSTEDSGENIFTFTNDDGTQSTFTVKNGSKGSNGTNGKDGTSAGFGTPTASVDANVGTPSVTVTATGSNTAKVFNFAFKNLKGKDGTNGKDGVTPTIKAASGADIGTVGTPSVTANTVGTETTFTFHNLKGAKGDKGENATTTSVATESANGLMSKDMVAKLNGIADNANKYTLPTASASTLGGVKVGSSLKIVNGVMNLVWNE